MCTFLFITSEIVFEAINIMSKEEHSFIGPVMLGILVAWIDVLATMYLRNNLIKVITFEVIVACHIVIASHLSLYCYSSHIFYLCLLFVVLTKKPHSSERGYIVSLLFSHRLSMNT